MSQEQNNPQPGWFRRGNRMVVAAVVVTVLAVGGFFGVQAVADSQTYKYLQLASAYKTAWHGGGDRHKRFAELSEEEIQSRVERMVKHVAIEIDATPEQQQKITTLVTALAKEVKPVHGRMRATGKEIHDLLLADSIDRAALEKLRAARLADADTVSKAAVATIADVAEVLSPAQRKLLEERIKEFRGMRRGWHRG